MKELEFEVKPTHGEKVHMSKIIERFLNAQHPKASLVIVEIFVKIVGLYLSAEIPIEIFMKDCAVMYGMVKKDYERVMELEKETD